MSETKIHKLVIEAQFDDLIKNLEDQMVQFQRQGNYVDAQNLRKKGLRLQKKHGEQCLAQMKNKHNEQIQKLQNDYRNNLAAIKKETEQWSQTYSNFCKKNTSEIDKNNEKQVQELRKTMQEQLTPNKMKESYQLLNFRQMEHHMSKQKDFTQAHLIQQRIKQVYEAQLKAWKQECKNKIEQAINNLKVKHAKERDLLLKKTQIEIEDFNNKQYLKEISLQQKYKNNLKELKAMQQRQIHSFKRSFTTKGGIFSDKFAQSQ